MGKRFVSVLLVLAVLVLTGCRNRKPADKPFEQVQLEAHIQMQIDSLAALAMSKDAGHVFIGLEDGSFILTDADRLVKPECLIDPASVSKLTRLDQKYRACSIIACDMQVARAYGMDIEPLKAALAKLVADINDPALKSFQENANFDTPADDMKKFYENEKANGRLAFFWDMNAAMSIETLYHVSHNADKFLPLFTDQDASDVTLRLFLILQSVQALSDYYPGMKELYNAMKPLEALNAMDVEELREQLTGMKAELESVRATLLR